MLPALDGPFCNLLDVLDYARHCPWDKSDSWQRVLPLATRALAYYNDAVGLQLTDVAEFGSPDECVATGLATALDEWSPPGSVADQQEGWPVWGCGDHKSDLLLLLARCLAMMCTVLVLSKQSVSQAIVSRTEAGEQTTKCCALLWGWKELASHPGVVPAPNELQLARLAHRLDTVMPSLARLAGAEAGGEWFRHLQTATAPPMCRTKPKAEESQLLGYLDEMQQLFEDRSAMQGRLELMARQNLINFMTRWGLGRWKGQVEAIKTERMSELLARKQWQADRSTDYSLISEVMLTGWCQGCQGGERAGGRW